MRHYQDHNGLIVSGYGNAIGVPFYLDFPLPVTMRVAPTVALSNFSNVNCATPTLNLANAAPSAVPIDDDCGPRWQLGVRHHSLGGTLMLADFVLELVYAVGTGLTITLPGAAPAGRVTWASRFTYTQPIFYVLDDTTQEEWDWHDCRDAGADHTRDDSATRLGTTARLNFAATTRCYSAWPAQPLVTALGANAGRNLFETRCSMLTNAAPGRSRQTMHILLTAGYSSSAPARSQRPSSLSPMQIVRSLAMRKRPQLCNVCAGARLALRTSR